MEGRTVVLSAVSAMGRTSARGHSWALSSFICFIRTLPPRMLWGGWWGGYPPPLFLCPPLPNFSGGKFFAPTPVPAIATSPSARHMHWPKSLSFVHPQPFASVGRTGPQPLSLHKAFEVPQMAELHAEPPGPQEPGICLAKWGESLG